MVGLGSICGPNASQSEVVKDCNFLKTCVPPPQYLQRETFCTIAMRVCRPLVASPAALAAPDVAVMMLVLIQIFQILTIRWVQNHYVQKNIQLRHSTSGFVEQHFSVDDSDLFTQPTFSQW
jgi:hypothetical protein